MTLLDPWLTKAPLAERLAAWAVDVDGFSSDHRVLEPSAGEGAIAIGLLKAGVQPNRLTLIELERSRAQLLKEAFAYSTVIHRCFLSWEEDLFDDGGPSEAPFELCVANPPFSDGSDSDHVEAMTHVARRVCVLVRVAFLTGSDRAARVYRHCKLTRVAFLVNRPQFDDRRTPEERLAKSTSDVEADGSPKHDFVCLELTRMTGRVAGWTRERDPIDRPEVEWW